MGVQKKEKRVNDVHKEIGVEVNTDIATYMSCLVMRMQDSHSIK
jgi:hypothetical protein